MTWSYSLNPSTTDKDHVRFLIGDTVEAEPLLSDEEINFLVLTWKDKHSIYWAAAAACEQIAARYAREASFAADGVSVSLGELQAKFQAQAETLREQHMSLLVGGTPDVGGISAYEQPDPSIAPLVFGTGMHDSREAGRQDYGQRSLPEFFPEDNPGA